MRYGLERLMYRIGQSAYAETFIVKGAMMFLVWSGATYRPTKDLDLLAVESASIERLAEIFRELCDEKVVDDALVFLPTTVEAEAIREESAYQGVRVKLEARLGKIKIPLQVDIGVQLKKKRTATRYRGNQIYTQGTNWRCAEHRHAARRGSQSAYEARPRRDAVAKVQMPRRQASHPILKVKNENLRRDARQRTDELPAHNQRDIVFFPVGDDGRYEPAHFQ